MGNEIVADLKTSLSAGPAREVDQKTVPMAPTSFDGRLAA